MWTDVGAYDCHFKIIKYYNNYSLNEKLRKNSYERVLDNNTLYNDYNLLNLKQLRRYTQKRYKIDIILIFESA